MCTLSQALEADEMFVMSSTRGVIGIDSVGKVAVPDTSFDVALENAMDQAANAM